MTLPDLDGHIRRECQKSRRSGRSHFFLKRYGRHKRAQCCVFEGGRAAHFSSVRAISSLRLTAKQCPHLIKVHRDVTFTFKFTSCRMHYATDKRGVRGEKPARQGEEGVIEKRILRICKHFCNFFFYHRQFPEEMSSFRVLSLYKHQLKMFFLKRNKTQGCQLLEKKNAD